MLFRTTLRGALLLAACGAMSACTTMVSFTSMPPGAKVTYLGNELGTTPFETSISDQFGWWSTYTFTANENGYLPATLDFHERTPLDAERVVPHNVHFDLAADPAAVKVAAAPPPRVVAPPPPAPPAPAPVVVDDRAPVAAAVQAWATAWSSRDLASYLAAYEPTFKGNLSSRKAWEAQRRQRILPRKYIAVQLSDVEVTVTGDRARATFTQAYASGPVESNDRKTLELQRGADGKWLIARETVGH